MQTGKIDLTIPADRCSLGGRGDLKFAIVVGDHKRKAGYPRMQALLICIQPSLLNYTFISAVGPGVHKWLAAKPRARLYDISLGYGSRGRPSPQWQSPHVIIRTIIPTSICLSPVTRWQNQVTRPGCSGWLFPSKCRGSRCLQATINNVPCWQRQRTGSQGFSQPCRLRREPASYPDPVALFNRGKPSKTLLNRTQRG